MGKPAKRFLVYFAAIFAVSFGLPVLGIGVFMALDAMKEHIGMWGALAVYSFLAALLFAGLAALGRNADG